jgi:hypothetical protein
LWRCSETIWVRTLLPVVFCQPSSFQDICSSNGPSREDGTREIQKALLAGSTATSRGSPESGIVAWYFSPEGESQLKENRARTLPTP